MIATVPVPQQYLGVWQRKHLESAAGVYDSSQVFWLQTPVLHADIRIPAVRPAFSDKTSLEDFSLVELKQLAGQKGFAGVTSVVGKTCLWLRHLDYQPRRDEHDIGYMEFNGTQLVETGLAKNYFEIWERLPESQGAAYAFQFSETNAARHPDKAQAGILVVSGDYFIFVRDRVVVLPPALSLDVILSDATLSRQQCIELLDFEISFGRVTGGKSPWEIQLSTLPFREGPALFSNATWATLSKLQGEYSQHEQSANGLLSRRWFLYS